MGRMFDLVSSSHRLPCCIRFFQPVKNLLLIPPPRMICLSLRSPICFLPFLKKMHKTSPVHTGCPPRSLLAYFFPLSSFLPLLTVNRQVLTGNCHSPLPFVPFCFLRQPGGGKIMRTGKPRIPLDPASSSQPLKPMSLFSGTLEIRALCRMILVPEFACP